MVCTVGNALKADSVVAQRRCSGLAVVGPRGFPSGAAVLAVCAVEGYRLAMVEPGFSYRVAMGVILRRSAYTAACFQGWPWTGPRGFPSGAATVQFCAVEDVRAGRVLGHEVFLQGCGACSLCSGGLTAGEDVTSSFLSGAAVAQLYTWENSGLAVARATRFSFRGCDGTDLQ